MKKISVLLTVWCLFSLSMVAVPVVAEPAPVYEADAMAQALEEAPIDEHEEDLPPPSPPTQDGSYTSSQVPAQAAEPILPRAQSLSLEQRVRRVEQQLNNMQNSDAANRLDSLQAQVQALRDQIERINHQVDTLQKQQKAMYSDLDKRLNLQMALTKMPTNHSVEAEPSLAKPESKVKAATVVQPNVVEEQKIYQTAYNFIKSKKYTEAVVALQDMLKKYPGGQFAANAHYWLGELYGLLGRHEQALVEFTSVVNGFPESPRVPDAQLKIALIYAAQSKWTEAKSAFHKITGHYPRTASARLAREQLKQIKEAGH